jgi:hypothetical protein
MSLDNFISFSCVAGTVCAWRTTFQRAASFRWRSRASRCGERLVHAGVFVFREDPERAAGEDAFFATGFFGWLAGFLETFAFGFPVASELDSLAFPRFRFTPKAVPASNTVPSAVATYLFITVLLLGFGFSAAFPNYSRRS